MNHPLCYVCKSKEGYKWKPFPYKGKDYHLKLCLTCKNRLFTPEGFIQFGYTQEKIAKIAKEGKGY